MQSRLLMTQRKKAFENIVRKGENAGNQHFLLFPQCFLPYHRQIVSFLPHLNSHLQMHSIWTSVTFSHLVKTLPFTTQSGLLTTLYKRPFEKIVGKGENADNQHFLLFPQCFQLFPFLSLSYIYFVVCKCFQYEPV